MTIGLENSGNSKSNKNMKTLDFIKWKHCKLKIWRNLERIFQTWTDRSVTIMNKNGVGASLLIKMKRRMIIRIKPIKRRLHKEQIRRHNSFSQMLILEGHLIRKVLCNIPKTMIKFKKWLIAKTTKQAVTDLILL